MTYQEAIQNAAYQMAFYHCAEISGIKDRAFLARTIGQAYLTGIAESLSDHDVHTSIKVRNRLWRSLEAQGRHENRKGGEK